MAVMDDNGYIMMVDKAFYIIMAVTMVNYGFIMTSTNNE